MTPPAGPDDDLIGAWPLPDGAVSKFAADRTHASRQVLKRPYL
jgi:hypothetical protein